MQQLINMVLFVTARFNVARDENDRGATATEYALLVALIAVAIVGGVTLLGGQIGTLFTNLGNKATGWANNAK